jgi:hypothetical protein
MKDVQFFVGTYREKPSRQAALIIENEATSPLK